MPETGSCCKRCGLSYGYEQAIVLLVSLSFLHPIHKNDSIGPNGVEGRCALGCQNRRSRYAQLAPRE